MTSWVRAISTSVPPAAMMPTPATCPAEVRLVAEMPTAAAMDSPRLMHKMPKPKDTDRYPRAMGMPSFSPVRNCFFTEHSLLLLRSGTHYSTVSANMP